MATPKRLKPSTSLQREREASVDRISTLPDCLISNILSFLPTKQAVGTSILSNRWKLLWTSITNLDFDGCDNEDDEEDVKFVLFVNRVLLFLNQPSIHIFRLRCDRSCDYRNINLWIDAAVARKTEELDLCVSCEISYPDEVNLPRIAFTSVTLVVLKLEGVLRLEISTKSFIFPSLKILHLIKVFYDNDECVSRLFANCSVLEDLVVKRVEWDGVNCFSICSPVMRKLNIDIGGDLDCWGGGVFKVQINAPALQYLELTDHASMDWAFGKLFSLVEANVNIGLCLMRDVDDYDDYDFAVYSFLQGLSNVNFLSLSGYTMKSLTSGTQFSAPKFCKLTRLMVRFTNRQFQWKVIPKLIQYSEKLEELICD